LPATVVVGCQWGDEGKGKIVDVLAEQCDIIARYQGGSNAGHTVVIEGKEYIFHMLPSGIMHPGKINVIGNGVVVDVIALADEIDGVVKEGVEIEKALKLSEQAHVILPLHKELDGAMEEARGANKIGTTKRGIGLAYADKVRRSGIRLTDFRNKNRFFEKYEKLATYHNEVLKFLSGKTLENWEDGRDKVWEFADRITPLLCDSVSLLNNALDNGKNVLCEGAQGILLDVDHGTYPYVTSSNPSTGGACTGLGIGPNRIEKVIGIVKAYTTRVGEGPMPTELHGEEGEKLRKLGGEFGATTGRPRRCGWLDIPILKRSMQIGGCTDLCITKLDVLDTYETLPVCTHYDLNGDKKEILPFDQDDVLNSKPQYEDVAGWNSKSSGVDQQNDLPENAVKYLNKISEYLSVPVTMVSTGPGREQTMSYKA